MILERKPTLNLLELRDQLGDALSQVDAADEPETFDALLKILEIQHIYSAAMNEMSTKLEILDNEFQMLHMHNPIHHLECRIKDPRSMIKKMERKNYPINVESAKENILDIAGIRVICNYIEDIYAVEKMLLKQADVRLLHRKDYIRQPKESGYRSLHIVVSVPVFLSESTEIVPVEIQIRTTAMDMWASLEHKLKYKNTQGVLNEAAVEKLRSCSTDLAKIEADMQQIHQETIDQTAYTQNNA